MRRFALTACFLAAGCAHSSSGEPSPTPASTEPAVSEQKQPAAPAQPAPLDDAILVEVREKLPEGWTLSLEADALLIRRTEKVLVLQSADSGPSDEEDELGADEEGEGEFAAFETPTERDFEERGGERTLEIVYALEPRWTEEMVERTHRENEEVGEQLARLAQKFNAGELYQEEKERRVARYERAYDELEAKLRRLPLCSTEKHSVFWDEAQELPDPDHGMWVWPEGALEEIDDVDRVLLTHCTTSKMGPDPVPRRQRRSKKRKARRGKKKKRKGKGKKGKKRRR